MFTPRKGTRHEDLPSATATAGVTAHRRAAYCVTVRVVDALEEIDVAQDECQGSTVARCAFHLAWEVLAEETPAVDAGQIVGGRQLAVLRQGHPQHALELRDAPCGAETSVELAFGRPPCQALVCAGGEASLALGGVIQLRHADDEWRGQRRPP